MTRTSLADLLSRADAYDHAAPPSAQDNAITARILLDARTEFLAPCPFKPGELILPRIKGVNMHVGVCLVLTVLPKPDVIEISGNRVSRDMTVLAKHQNGHLCELIVCSREFERYAGPVTP